MKILAIWEDKETVKSKAAHSLKELKKLKHNGKKPDKIIIHERDILQTSLKEVKKHVKHNGIIMQVGSENKCLFDGRRKYA